LLPRKRWRRSGNEGEVVLDEGVGNVSVAVRRAELHDAAPTQFVGEEAEPRAQMTSCRANGEKRVLEVDVVGVLLVGQLRILELKSGRRKACTEKSDTSESTCVQRPNTLPPLSGADE